MRRKAAITAGAIVTAGSLAWAVPTLAHAEDDPTTEPSAGATAPDGADGADGADERREAMRTELAERLAEELGIDADEVAEALESVTEELRAEHQAERLAGMEERLAEAVEDGRITQERADELLKAAEDGDLRGRMGRMGGHHGGPRGFGPGGEGGPGAGVDPDTGTDSGTTAYTL